MLTVLNYMSGLILIVVIIYTIDVCTAATANIKTLLTLAAEI